MTDPRLAELRRAYLDKERTAASMEEGSVASVADPFGFSRTKSTNQRVVGGDETRRFSSSSSQKPSNTLLGRPPLNQRLTIQTIASTVSHSEDDSPDSRRASSPASALTTPTNNSGTPPSTMGASIRPVNLSAVSPQHTAFSQITTSPDANRSQPSRRMTTESAGGTSRFSQSILTQLQSQLRMTQTDLQSAREDKRRVESQHKQQVNDLQTQLQQLQAQVGTNQALAVKQSQLDQLQSDLDAKATELQRQEQAQQERLDQEWERLQTTITELETTQLQEEHRLQDWEDQLDGKQLSIEEAQEQFQRQQQAHDNLLQRKATKLETLRKRLVGWEQRLEEQATALDDREQAVMRQEETIRSSIQQIELERAEIDDAVRELELKSSSTEARFELVEQALQEATEKRQQEESKLETAMEKQKQAMAHADTIMNDCQRVKESLELKNRLTEEEYAALQDEIDEKTDELESLKERLRVFMAEDTLQQERANERLHEVDRKVKRMLEQVELATREKDTLSKMIADKRGEHDALVQHIRTEEEESKRRHTILIRQCEEEVAKIEQDMEVKRAALIEADEKAAQTRSDAEAEAKRIFAETSQRIAEFATETTLQAERTHSDFEAKGAQLESLHITLQRAVEKLGTDMEKLQADKALCDDLAKSLSEKLALLSASEVCEKRRREELEWEVERLSSLLRNERETNLKRIELAGDELETERDRHRELLRSTCARLEEAEATSESLQEQVESLQTSRNHEKAEHERQIESRVAAADELQRDLDRTTQELERAELSLKLLLEEKALLTDQLQEAEGKAEAYGVENEHLTRALARAADDEKKMESLLNSLQSQFLRAEAKEAELELERERVHKLGEDYKARLGSLQQEEMRITDLQAALHMEKEQQRVATVAFNEDRKKHALSVLFAHRLRQDNEAISAALSKWVRSTLFDLAEEEKESLLNVELLDLKERLRAADATRAELENARDALLAHERDLLDTRARLQAEVEDSKTAEAGVRRELDLANGELLTLQQAFKSLEADKNLLTTELEAMKTIAQTHIGNGNGNSNVNGTSQGTYHDVAQRVRHIETLITERETELLQKLASIGEREKTLKLKERQFAVQFEETDGRMRETAELLRKKELDLELKETHLAAELAKCKDTHERLHKLALSIQAKAQQVSNDQSALATRMKECDELESQLTEWQKRLEAYKCG